MMARENWVVPPGLRWLFLSYAALKRGAKLVRLCRGWFGCGRELVPLPKWGKPRLYPPLRAIISLMPDADWLRQLCLSLPDSTEKLQWGENLCFKVRGKIFAIVDLSAGNLTPITLKCAPEQFHEFLEIEGISQAPYVGRYQWILLENSNVLPARELEALIRRSYDLVAAKAPRKKTARKRTPHNSQW